MSKIDDGGPAFPHLETKILKGGASYQKIVEGMSLRDWFAGQAMAIVGHRSWDHLPQAEIIGVWANTSYAIADAMLKARETEQ